MVRGGQFGHAYLLGSLLLLAASLHPPTAYSAPGDPPSGSPAGAVYQLPLEQGRSDAAPKGGGGTAAGAAGGNTAGGDGGSGSAAEPSQPGSLYRSENNFGSSSRVPGVGAAGAGAAAGEAGGGAAGGGSGAAGAAIAAGAVAAQTSDNGNTSVAAAVVLLGAIALLAVAVGVASRRFSQR